MLGWFQDARSHYDAHKSEADWWLEITGQDNRTFKPVSGRYRVIGPWQGLGLILETPAGPVTACHEGQCDWYAERAILQRGQEERTTTQTVRAQVTSVLALRRALEPLEAFGRVYLSGTLRGRVPGSPPTVAVSDANGGTITLSYATPAALSGWTNNGIYDLVLIVQVRHIPGARVPTLALESERAQLSPHLVRQLPE